MHMPPSLSFKRIKVSPLRSQNEWKLANLNPCLDPLKSREVTKFLFAKTSFLRKAISSFLFVHLDSGRISSRGSTSI
jgi:hypothetical protein